MLACAGTPISRMGVLYGGVLDEIDYRGSGAYTQYTGYDAFMRPATIDNPGTAYDQTYTYDYKGNVSSWNGTAYGYDGLDRLVSPSYTYDVISNVTDGPSARYTYKQLSSVDTMRLSAATLGSTTTTFTDDGTLGNLVSATGRYSGLTYDAFNQLTSINDLARVSGSASTDTYAYNPEGLRYKKTESGTGTTTYYLYEGNNILYLDLPVCLRLRLSRLGLQAAFIAAGAR
jgi:YD repeat-containing protein